MENHPPGLAMESLLGSPGHHGGLVGDKSKTAVGVQGPRGLVFQDHLVPRSGKFWENGDRKRSKTHKNLEKNRKRLGEQWEKMTRFLENLEIFYGEIWRCSENQLKFWYIIFHNGLVWRILSFSGEKKIDFTSETVDLALKHHLTTASLR